MYFSKKNYKYGAVDVVVDIHISYNNSTLFLRRIPSGIPLPFFLEISQEISLRIKLPFPVNFLKYYFNPVFFGTDTGTLHTQANKIAFSYKIYRDRVKKKVKIVNKINILPHLSY